jgi:hypothetical protein
MGIWVTQRWSVREADKDRCLEALQVITDHILTDHSEVRGVRTELQWVGDQAHRGISCADHSESLTSMEAGVHTPTCVEVWAPVYAMTLPGTYSRSVWLDADPSWHSGQ